MKFSKAQERAINGAKQVIDKARSFDNWIDWAVATSTCTREYIECHMEREVWRERYWKEYREGNVLTNCGKNTIDALVKKGVFTVVEFTKGRNNYVLDWVHLNNY